MKKHTHCLHPLAGPFQIFVLLLLKSSNAKGKQALLYFFPYFFRIVFFYIPIVAFYHELTGYEPGQDSNLHFVEDTALFPQQHTDSYDVCTMVLLKTLIRFADNRRISFLS